MFIYFIFRIIHHQQFSFPKFSFLVFSRFKSLVQNSVGKWSLKKFHLIPDTWTLISTSSFLNVNLMLLLMLSRALNWIIHLHFSRYTLDSFLLLSPLLVLQNTYFVSIHSTSTLLLRSENGGLVDVASCQFWETSFSWIRNLLCLLFSVACALSTPSSNR